MNQLWFNWAMHNEGTYPAWGFIQQNEALIWTYRVCMILRITCFHSGSREFFCPCLSFNAFIPRYHCQNIPVTSRNRPRSGLWQEQIKGVWIWVMIIPQIHTPFLITLVGVCNETRFSWDGRRFKLEVGNHYPLAVEYTVWQLSLHVSQESRLQRDILYILWMAQCVCTRIYIEGYGVTLRRQAF